MVYTHSTISVIRVAQKVPINTRQTANLQIVGTHPGYYGSLESAGDMVLRCVQMML